MKRILITGANGFVGKALLQRLNTRLYDITVLDRCPSDLEGVQSIVADITQPIKNAPEKPFDVIVHLAGATLHLGITDDLLFSINVNGTQNVLESFLQPSGHVVFFSTGLVYGPSLKNAKETDSINPVGTYELSKIKAEAVVSRIAEKQNATYTIFRPSVIYGQGAPSSMYIPSLIKSLQENSPFSMTAGEQFRDFIHIDDVTQAVSIAIETKLQGIFNLSLGEAFTLSEIADFLGHLSGKNHLIYKGAIPYRENESFTYSLNSEKLQNHTPWRPQISIKQGVLALWNSTLQRNIP